MARTIRVGLLMANRLNREGRQLLLNSQSDMDVVWQESDGELAIESLTEATVDVVLVDVRLKSMAGTDFIRRFLLRQVGSQSAIPSFILSSPFGGPELALDAIRSGASDFVSDEGDPEELLVAIREAGADDQSVDLPLLWQLFESQGVLRGSVPRWHLRMGEVPETERRLFELLAGGTNFDDLGATLRIAAGTVRGKVQNLKSLLGFATNVQLALAAFEAGELETGSQN